MTPLKSIRKFCVQCAGSSREVSKCGGHRIFGDDGNESNRCLFYKFRKGRGRPSVKIIRKHCLACMGGSYDLVRNCTSFECPVYIFRFGKNPNKILKPTQRTERILSETTL